MESFLNFLWVVLAVCGLYLWRVRWARQPHQSDHAPWRQWTAFVCALILLFFMVSLTDDLHSELVVYEESSASRRHTTCVDCPHHPPPAHLATTFAILDHPAVDPVFSLTALSSGGDDFHFAAPVPISLAGRAPPDFSL